MEENSKELEYRVDRSTVHGDYVALVSFDKDTRKHHIELYEGEPYINEFFGLFRLQKEPIAERTIGPYSDVNATITKMIIDYELPYYQRAKTQTSDHFLDIDYEEELKKRKPKPIPDQEEEQPKFNPIIVRDWQDDQVHIIKRNIHPNSLLNLKQFQHLKKSK